MALYKERKLENGIITKYHRIVSLNKITNQNNIIEIASYIDKQQREKEKVYQKVQIKKMKDEEITDEEKDLLEKGIDIFIDTNYMSKDYDEQENIEECYDFLKTIAEFKDAENV